MLKLVVFDWDGTLADSVAKIIACKKFLAEKYNLPAPTDETVKNVLGTKFEEALANCFPTAEPSVLSNLGKEFHSLMQQDTYQATLFPNTKQMLERLKQQGLMLAIATSKERKELDKAILFNNLFNMFDVICCGKEHKEKPDPAMLTYIMTKCNVKVDQCLMVGDTTVDMKFAANAGIKAVGVTFGAHSAIKLQSMNPLALIDKWTQLVEVIETLCHSQEQTYSPSFLQVS